MARLIKKVYRILDALVHKEASRLLQEVRDLSDFSPDYRSVLASFSSILHRIALEQVVPGVTDNSMGDKEQVSFYAQSLCAEDVQLFYQIALTSRQDLQISPDLKSGFEMALLRMLAFQLAPLEEGQRADLNSGDVNHSEIVSPEPTANEAETNSNMQPRQASPQAEASEQVVDTEQAPIVEASTLEPSDSGISQDAVSEIEGSEAIQAVESSSDSSLDMKPDQTDDQQFRATNESQSAEPISTSDANSDLSDQKKKLRAEPNTIPSGWNADVTELGLSGMTLNFLLNSVVEFQGDTIQVFVETGHYRLFNDNHEKRITEALLAFYSDYSHIVCVEGLKQGHETPMMWRERLMKERKEHARDLIFNDPNVDQIVQEFQANIIEQSIQPVDALK
ncbi:MAG: DNA polymerase III subunit gamma/tau C-terminal domain-containing protein [Oleiphilus sp.]